ncbi:hypothetical protein B0H11DRAFT_2254853 [Mycena galericulata]|nr:hypothetical protein B0H11DRAFT_2254853 [Mycena galericulata]
MSTFPQELIDTILKNVGFEDLKTCSLSAPNLRVTSQRILLSSLTLGTVTPEKYILSNFNAVYALLDESPHLIAYITRLRIYASPLTMVSPTDVETLQKIFRKLINVRRCDIGVRGERIFKKTLSPGISETITAYVSHHDLAEVHVWDVALSPDVVSLLVSRVPKLSFAHTEVQGDWHSRSFTMTRTSGPSSLETGCCSDSICAFLSAPHFTQYTESLRRLAIVPYQPHSTRLQMVASSRLEYVHFDGLGHASRYTISPLPSMPSLRFASIAVVFLDENRSWLPVILSAILDSSSTVLEEIAIYHYPVLWSTLPRESLDLDKMTALDTRLATHLARPRLRLCYDLHKLDQSEQESLTAYILRGMPRIHEQGRLVVENYKFSHEATIEEWSTRR